MVLPATLAAGGGFLSSLGTIGSFASGLGSLASGLGLGGNKGPGINEQINHSLRHQKESARINNYSALDYRYQFAKDRGLHPAAVLGVPASGGSSFSGSYNDRTIDLAQMGQGVDRALNAGRTGVQRKLDDLALEKAQLSNDYLRTQIAGAQKAITRTGATVPIGRGTDGSFDMVDIVPDEQTSKNSKDTGITAGTHSAFRIYDLGNGHVMEAPYNQEGWSEAIGEMPWPYKWYKMGEALTKRFHGKHYKNTPGYWLAKHKSPGHYIAKKRRKWFGK
jgi:hypothetical protein